MAKIRDGGSWKSAGIPYVKVDGVWRQIQKSWSKIDGSYRLSTLGSPPPPPTLVRDSYSKFRISNYDSSLTYTTQYVSGDSSGATVSGNIMTIAGANSAYRIQAAYLPGGNVADGPVAERKAYTYYTNYQCYWVDTSYDDCSGTVSCRSVTTTGDQVNCAPYAGSCSGIVVNNGSGGCICLGDSQGGPGKGDSYYIGDGLCPAQDGWYRCGNNCCVTQTICDQCTSPYTWSGSACCRRVIQGYWASCQVKNPTPSGFTDSGGEWWRIY